MDSDPLVPSEISPTKKYLMFGTVGLLAIYLLVVMILLIVKAKEFHHFGLYFSAIALLALTIVIVILNISLPQDYMDNKAKYSVIALNLCLFVIATGLLIHAFEKTPCKCPTPNLCTISSFPEGGWFQKPECFTADRNSTFITLSMNRTCPAPGQFNDAGPLVNFEASELQYFAELDNSN